MGTRSRLRTRNVKRRRLLLLVFLLAVSLAAVLWYGITTRPELWEQVWLLVGREENAQRTFGDTVRGTIYDRNYKELAVSYERVSVYANIREIDNLGRVIKPISEIVGIPESSLYEHVAEGSLRIWLAKDISQEQEEEIRGLDLPGIHLHKEFVRYYPQKDSAAHLIGFVERGTGLSGVEHYLNQLETRHRLGKESLDHLPELSGSKPGADGKHLILTLDLKIQQILDRYLEKLSSMGSGIKVGALVMEAGSGSLVGYSQIPSFDPNRFHTYSQETFTDIFNETFAVPEPFKIFLRDVSLLESQAGMGLKSLPWSIAAEKRKLGVQLQLWDRLGAGSRNKHDFTADQGALSDRVAHRPPLEPQSNFETVPVMQTPLQLLTAVARIVNGGMGIVPHSADRFVVRSNQREFLLEDLNPVPKRAVLQDGVSVEARELFRVQSVPGPVGSAALEGFSTSYRMNGGMSSFRRHYVFVAVVPIREPELIVMITASFPGNLPAPQSGLQIGDEALSIIPPIVALQRVMKNLADMMSAGNKEEVNFSGPGSDGQQNLNKTMTAAGQQVDNYIKMPSLTGMSLRKSLRLLQGADVDIEVQGSGRVVDQQPVAGSSLKTGKRVLLVLERDKVDADYKQQDESKRE